MSEMEIPLLTTRMAELGLEVVGPIHERDDPWVYQLTDGDEDAEWWVACAGPDHGGEEIGPPDGMTIESRPYHFAAWCNGWLVFHAPPGEATIMGHDTEDDLIDLLEAELRERGVDLEGGDDQ